MTANVVDLMPGLFGVGGVVDLGRVPVPFRPAQVDAPQALRPVGRVRPARLRVDRDQRLAGVVLAGQQGADLQLVDLPAEHRQVAGGFHPGGLVVLALGQLEQHPRVAQAVTQADQPGQLAVEVGQPAGDRLGLLLVFPERRVGRPLPQAVCFLPHGVRVKDGLHAGEFRRQFRDFAGGIGCHGGSLRQARQSPATAPSTAGLRQSPTLAACWRSPGRGPRGRPRTASPP